jgi:ABC-type maltose transport system permease subunit
MEENENMTVSNETENLNLVDDDLLDAVKEDPTAEELGENGSALVAGVMQEKDMQQVTAKQRIMKILVQVGLYLFLGVMALIVLFPFYWMIISSLKTLDEYELRNPTFFPNEFHFQNYANAFSKANMGRLFLNTLYVGVVSTLLSLVITILAAFAFSRL